MVDYNVILSPEEKMEGRPVTTKRALAELKNNQEERRIIFYKLDRALVTIYGF